jgi:hypothetical protein
MGGIVKSIGRAVKKVGRGIKKFVRKVLPKVVLAAAIWAGVAMLGAGGMTGAFTSATGAFDFGAANFMKGLSTIGTAAKGFFMPSMGPQMSFADYKAGELEGFEGFGDFPSDAVLRRQYMDTVSQGMSMGDALAYMTKMNLFSTGVKAAAGLMEPTEAEKQAKESERFRANIQQIKDEGGFVTGKSPLDKYRTDIGLQQPSEPTLGRQQANLMSGPTQTQVAQSRGASPYLSRSPGLITQAANRRLA